VSTFVSRLHHEQLLEHGFAILPRLFTDQQIDGLIAAVCEINSGEAVRRRHGVYAVRNLLDLSAAIRDLAYSPEMKSFADSNLGRPSFAVRATLFDKTNSANWLVPWHQDLTICVASRIDAEGYGPWSVKAGVVHVQPPVSILENMLSVRIHLDDCTESNGALQVLPGTHNLGRLSAENIATLQKQAAPVHCAVERGAVLIMRPLLLHASSSASNANHRRVIHIDYACSDLPGGLRWYALPDV
jgi:hypothetical protein